MASLQSKVNVAGVGGYATEMAMAIALPGEHAPMRLPAGGECTTAVRFRNEFATTTPTNAGYLWTAGDTLVALFGQPGRAAMIYGAYRGTSSNYVYTASFVVDGEDMTQWAPDPNDHTFAVAGRDKSYGMPFPFAGAYCTSNGPHGPSLGVGESKGYKFFFLDKHDTMRIVTPTTSATGSLSISVLWWQEDNTAAENKRLEIALGTLPNTGNFTPTQAGWFAFELESVSLTAGTLAGGWRIEASILVGGGAVPDAGRWRLLPYADFDGTQNGDPLMAEYVRTNAASCLVQNTTAQLTAQGTVLAARVRTEALMKIDSIGLGRLADKYSEKAILGCYTFLANTEHSETFRNCRSGTNSKFLTYHLDEVEYIHLMRFSNPNPTSAPNEFNVVVDGAFEFIADSARYTRSTVPPQVTLESLHKMRVMINGKPVWFYENPLHMRDIYGFVKRGVKAIGYGIGRAAPVLSTVATALDPAGAAGYQALGALLSRLAV